MHAMLHVLHVVALAHTLSLRRHISTASYTLHTQARNPFNQLLYSACALTPHNTSGFPVENDVYSITVGLIAVWCGVTVAAFVGRHIVLSTLQREALLRAIATWTVILVSMYAVFSAASPPS
jgi:hypothetical protein